MYILLQLLNSTFPSEAMSSANGDEDLYYTIDPSKLEICNVFTEIKAVFDLQSKYNPIIVNKNFSFPLNPEYVKSRFGKSAYQVKSGNSVVIMCPEERAVYKYPMNGRENHNL